MPKKVIIVGGIASFVNDAFKAKFATAGLQVIEHWAWKAPQNPNLKGIDALLLIAEMSNDSLDAKAKRLATNSNIPCLNIGRTWSNTLPTLQRAGLVPADFAAKTAWRPDCSWPGGCDNFAETGGRCEAHAEPKPVPIPPEVITRTPRRMKTSAPTEPAVTPPTNPKHSVVSPTTRWRVWRKSGDVWRIVEVDIASEKTLRTFSIGRISKEIADTCAVGITAIALGKPSARGITVDAFVELARQSASTLGDLSSRRELIIQTLTEVANRERQEEHPMRRPGELPLKLNKPLDLNLPSDPKIGLAMHVAPAGLIMMELSPTTHVLALPPLEEPDAAMVEEMRQELDKVETKLKETEVPPEVKTPATDDQIYAKIRELQGLISSRQDWVDVKIFARQPDIEVYQAIPTKKTVKL